MCWCNPSIRTPSCGPLCKPEPCTACGHSFDAHRPAGGACTVHNSITHDDCECRSYKRRPAPVQPAAQPTPPPAQVPIAIPRACNACGAPLLLAHVFVDDGCPCNSPRGVNFKPMPCTVCSTATCVKPGHRLDARHSIVLVG